MIGSQPDARPSAARGSGGALADDRIGRSPNRDSAADSRIDDQAPMGLLTI
jgi:hypothetical protein